MNSSQMEKFNKKPYIIGTIVFLLMFGALYLYEKSIKKATTIKADTAQVSIAAGKNRKGKKKSNDSFRIAPSVAPGF